MADGGGGGGSGGSGSCGGSDDHGDDGWLRAKQEKAQMLFEAHKNQSAPILTATFPIFSLALAHYP